MRDKNAGDLQFVMQSSQPASQLLAHLSIQRPEWFVQQQHAGFHRQCPCQGDALALPPRELRRKAIGQPVQLHQLQQGMHTPADLGLAGTLRARLDLQAEGNVVKHAHMPEQRVMLEYEANLSVPRLPGAGVIAIEQHIAAIGTGQPGNDA